MSKIADEVNDEVIEGENKSSVTTFASKKSKNAKSKNLTFILNLGATKELIFLTPDTRKTFNQLRLAFIQALILQHFNLECHFWIETDVLGYTIGRVLS